MLNTEQWLNSFITKQAGNSVQDDMTLPILVDLYNQGYDRVEWVGSDRCIAEDDTDEICHRYDSDKTTWTLRDFLCITSGFNFGIPKKAYKRTWLEKDWSMLTDEQKADVLRTPTNAFNYACSLDYTNIPEEVIEAVAQSTWASGNLVYRWLKNNAKGPIPQPLVDAAVNEIGSGPKSDWVYYISENFRNNPNLPHEFDMFLKGEDTENTYKEKAEGHKYTISDTHVPFDAPMYSHSHVGCKCFLRVYKSTDPADQVLIDATGGQV